MQFFLPKRHLGFRERRGDVRRTAELLGGGGRVRLRGAAVVEEHVERRLALLAAAAFDAGRRGVAAKTQAQPFGEHQSL